MTIELTVTEQQLQTILLALQKQPLESVLDTFVTLQRQAQEFKAANQPQLRAVEDVQNVSE